MNYYDEDNVVDEIIEAIEFEYGEKIQRLVKLDNIQDGFKMTIIFTDYRLLEAKVKIKHIIETPSIIIQGTYY